MKKLILAFITLVTISCQKAELKECDSRSTQEEQKDSTSVTPTFEAEDWEGVIDVNFRF